MKESCENLMCFVYVISLYKTNKIYTGKRKIKITFAEKGKKKKVFCLYTYIFSHTCADALIHYCAILGLRTFDQVFIISFKTYIRYARISKYIYPYDLKINCVNFRKNFLQSCIILQILQ